MKTGKVIALTRQTFVDEVMSLLFNMLSRSVIIFLPRSKHLLISWLQSPSAVILLLLLLLSRFSHVRLCVTPWTAAHQASLSMGFSRQEHWSGLPFPSQNAWNWKVKVKSLSRFWLLATPWTAAYQAPPCMGFSRQQFWSGVPLPSPSDFGSPQNKACHCFHCFPIYLPWSDGTRCHDLSFLNVEF